MPNTSRAMPAEVRRERVLAAENRFARAGDLGTMFGISRPMILSMA